ncbi:ATP-binding protein [Streptomyces sp. NPDC088745]|uniref:ATP-binding protein n=1 Tax=Streptomyces sp. NPDC088745 TaxID=3365884 RepID=UPI003820D8C6
MQLEVGADPAEVGRARRWARSRLVGCGIQADEPVAETLVLLISELVTNAVVHTGCPAVLRMLLPGGSDEAGSPANGAGGADGPGDAGGVAAAGGPHAVNGVSRPHGASGADEAAASGPAFGPASGPAMPDGTVRVEVADASSCPPRPRRAEGDDTNGRGLELVDGLADRWGWQAEGAGKRIWCEVDRRVRTPESACADRAEAAGCEGLGEGLSEKPYDTARDAARGVCREPGAASAFGTPYEPPFEPSYKPPCAVTNRT